MKNLFTLFLVSIITFKSLSQINTTGIYLTDPKGSLIDQKTSYKDINGTPYMFPDWLTGDLVTSAGIYKSIQLKLNLYTQEIIYLNKENQELVVPSETVDTVKINNKGFIYNWTYRTVVGKAKKLELARILVNGKVSLYKIEKKKIEEYKEFNSAVYTRKFKDEDGLYVDEYGTGLLVRVEKEKEFWMKNFPNQSEKIDVAFSSKKLKLKSEEGVLEFVTFLNN